MHVIAALKKYIDRSNLLRHKRTALIQKQDMSVKLVANISQKISSLQVTSALQKRIKWNKNS